MTPHYRKRYNTKATNWNTFDFNLTQSLLKNFECRTNPNNNAACDSDLSQKVKNSDDTEVIQKFTLAVTTACDESFQVLRPGKRASKERSVGKIKRFFEKLVH